MKYIFVLALVATLGVGCAKKRPPDQAAVPQAPQGSEQDRNAPINAPRPPSAPPQPSLQPSAVPAKPGPLTLNVSITDAKFEPQELAVHVGDTVVWTNAGKMGHSVTSKPVLLWDSGNLTPGQSYKRTFTAAGTYMYGSGVGKNVMEGKVIVYEVEK